MSRTSDLVALLPLVAFAAFAACGCAEPGQYGGLIPIDQAGVEGRLQRVCVIAPQSVCGALSTDEVDADEGGVADDADAHARVAPLSDAGVTRPD